MVAPTLVARQGASLYHGRSLVTTPLEQMPDPRDVFNDPQRYWPLLTSPADGEFEGQRWDRKEACRPGKGQTVSDREVRELRLQVVECVSAFANANETGGLLVLGISSDGQIRGLRHLTEQQRNSLTSLDDVLVNHGAQVRLHDCMSHDGAPDAICLIYVPHAKQAICGTVGRSPKAWKRVGPKNVLLSDAQKDQLRRDKRILDFERTPCCAFGASDLDTGVTREFRAGYLAEAHYEKSDDEVLYQNGAIVRDREDKLFTNAGLLFFAANPQRVLPAASLRLLRFDVPFSERASRPLPTFEKYFTGPITKQLRDFRTFLKESAFFKTYQRRNPTGGFVEEPEYPHIAVDEAVVNAVAHRDYAIQLPTVCEKYADALVVTSPGRIVQPIEVPESFSLSERSLEHLPRNPTLMNWLKSMKDAQGSAFVRALREGTRQMRDSMAELGLPAPEYAVTESSTTVILRSNAAQREAALRVGEREGVTQFANLYPIVGGFPVSAQLKREEETQLRRDFLNTLGAKLAATGWYVDSLKFGVLTAHRRGNEFSVPEDVARHVRLFPAYTFQVREYWGRVYVVVDFTLVVQTVLRLADACKLFNAGELIGLPAVAKWRGWQRARLTSVDGDTCRVYLFDYNTEETVPTVDVIPRLPRCLIEAALTHSGIEFDLAKEIKRAGLGLQPGAARTRAERVHVVVQELAQSVFPLHVASVDVEIATAPLPIAATGDGVAALRVVALSEPAVEFSDHRKLQDIREGITKFGSYDHSPREVEIVPICPPELREHMGALIERLRAGKFKYRGSERTFSTRLTYTGIVTTGTAGVVGEAGRLLEQHPDWVGDGRLQRIFLVHCPEEGYALDDERGPYYEAKRLILGSGVPCQMVDTPTLLNPDFKDLNLALNIVAKTGVVPWVLPESIPDADFFIGLSYTQSSKGERERFMAFANVFNEYGRWEFYSGSTEPFNYDERGPQFEALVRRTLSRLTLPEAPSIWFHYSAKFSRDDRAAILRAARGIRPKGTYAFVWINTQHHVRLYDSRPESDGSLSRGSYVAGSPNQIYLSTTGFNPYRKVLGTPQALEINLRVEYPQGVPPAPPDLRSVAAQVLGLTKLNWASTDSLCGEPITTKYAGDIAYLTAAFLRQGRTFQLHPVLERTPWFI